MTDMSKYTTEIEPDVSGPGLTGDPQEWTCRRCGAQVGWVTVENERGYERAEWVLAFRRHQSGLHPCVLCEDCSDKVHVDTLLEPDGDRRSQTYPAVTIGYWMYDVDVDDDTAVGRASVAYRWDDGDDVCLDHVIVNPDRDFENGDQHFELVCSACGLEQQFDAGDGYDIEKYRAARREAELALANHTCPVGDVVVVISAETFEQLLDAAARGLTDGDHLVEIARREARKVDEVRHTANGDTQYQIKKEA